MKFTLRLQALLIGATIMAGSLFAEEAPKITSTADFKKLLIDNTWTWERSDMKMAKMKFKADGTVRHERFVVKYVLKGTNKVELRSAAGKKTLLVFTPDYSGWEGVDFDGVRAISGKKTTDD